MSDVTVELFGSKEVSGLLSDILAVYQETFSQFPYNYSAKAAEARDPIIRYEHKLLDGFQGAVARDSFGRIVGFLYGYTSGEGQWWHDQVRPTLAGVGKQAWLENCFEIVDFAVIPSLQNQGVGGRLIDKLLHAAPHERSILSTLQQDTPAWRFYKKRGWQLLAENFMYTNGTRKNRILGLELL